ncbi:MAG: family 2 glycosyl transferase [Clostridiaceae bacterium]|nr:family 2 glycosyl transferase [Clostridiaceae bacterium]
MRKYFIVIIILILSVFTSIKLYPVLRDKLSINKKDGISFIAKVDSQNFYINQYGSWKKQFVKGVNIGAAKPGSFPGELSITKADYLRWFKEIGKMNANTIRVYTILSPEFYDALYEYNHKSITPIYVMHGVWVNETDIAALKNAYDPKINDRFKKDIKTTIDVIHGNSTIEQEAGHASGSYTKDVSMYVSAWVLGIEWDSDFVVNTNKLNETVTSFQGKYLFSKDASPFENWLSQIGDYSIKYETEKYGMQRPLSFTNWVTTDPLSHPNEPLVYEDQVSVNVEHIKAKADFLPGCFASYHIYPYYPDFMNYQKEYYTFKDSTGKINTYEAYLKDLRKIHTMPVLVAEFGIPAARGKAHDNIYMGYNQGNVSESDQGQMVANMLTDIETENYMGGLVFSWQDEWFKRTWNTMDLDIPDRRAYWSNTQTNEQEFGLLAFDPGAVKTLIDIDGNVADWNKIKPLTFKEDTNISVTSDEKYVYFRVHSKNFDINKDKFLIPIDTISNQGNTNINHTMDLDRATDFLIQIDGKDNSKILVDGYYDSFYYIYSRFPNNIPRIPQIEEKNSGIFNSIYLCLNKELLLPEDNTILPLSKYETGKLKFGNGNPSSNEFNSLVDFNIMGDEIEIRIPWQLLNVLDPSSKNNMDDLYKDGIKPKYMDGIYIGGILLKEGKVNQYLSSEKYDWDKWDIPTYHERLKPSYYILQKAFKEIGGRNK